MSTFTQVMGRNGMGRNGLGTNFPQSRPLVKDCQFGVSPVNYSDSDSEMVMGRNGHGPKWFWAEMTSDPVASPANHSAMIK